MLWLKLLVKVLVLPPNGPLLAVVAGIALAEMEASAVPGFERSQAAVDANGPARRIEVLTSGTTGPPIHLMASG